jgi:hypothetical protein
LTAAVCYSFEELLTARKSIPIAESL